MNERGTQQGRSRKMPEPASIAFFTSVRLGILTRSYSLKLVLHPDPEAIQRAVVGGEEGMRIADGYSRHLRIRGNLRSAGVQLFTCGRVEDVEPGVRLAVSLGESDHHAVRNHEWRGV